MGKYTTKKTSTKKCAKTTYFQFAQNFFNKTYGKPLDFAFLSELGTFIAKADKAGSTYKENMETIVTKLTTEDNIRTYLLSGTKLFEGIKEVFRSTNSEVLPLADYYTDGMRSSHTADDVYKINLTIACNQSIIVVKAGKGDIDRVRILELIQMLAMHNSEVTNLVEEWQCNNFVPVNITDSYSSFIPHKIPSFSYSRNLTEPQPVKPASLENVSKTYGDNNAAAALTHLNNTYGDFIPSVTYEEGSGFLKTAEKSSNNSRRCGISKTTTISDQVKNRIDFLYKRLLVHINHLWGGCIHSINSVVDITISKDSTSNYYLLPVRDSLEDWDNLNSVGNGTMRWIYKKKITTVSSSGKTRRRLKFRTKVKGKKSYKRSNLKKSYSSKYKSKSKSDYKSKKPYKSSYSSKYPKKSYKSSKYSSNYYYKK